MIDPEEHYPCVGICTPDPDSGYCLGCGRPPLETPQIVAEAPPPAVDAANLPGGAARTDPDGPD